MEKHLLPSTFSPVSMTGYNVVAVGYSYGAGNKVAPGSCTHRKLTYALSADRRGARRTRKKALARSVFLRAICHGRRARCQRCARQDHSCSYEAYLMGAAAWL